MTYFDRLCDAMTLCEKAGAVFMGQAVAFPGTAMSKTLAHIAPDRRIELPVAEEMQLGMAAGVALAGGLPITIYPRWNFLLLAANQLVNHLDKLPDYSDYRPRVIVRTAVAARHPMHPGPQHLGNLTPAFRQILDNIVIEELITSDAIVPAYERALTRRKSSLLVEFTSIYDMA